MSEATEKVLGIETLPVFPLPMVLLPNELLPLHIFEPRYRQMLADIELKKNIFGISFIESSSGVDRPRIDSVGCAAEVREVQPLPDGRSNVATLGVIRYRIVDFSDEETPYLTCKVEFFEDEDEADQQRLADLTDEVYESFERIAKAAFRLSGGKGQFPEIPKAEPEKLSFLIMAAFNLDPALKQELIETTSTVARLERLKTITSLAVGQMESSVDISRVAHTNGHAAKKIDL